MNDIFDARIGRLGIHVATAWPYVRLSWNRIPWLISDFGWLWLWIRGVGNYSNGSGFSCKFP